jgi:asparagine synthase (glutamine-hydrolysing)
MCGIGGILRVHQPGQAPPPPETAIPEAWLDVLDESIRHRGPDGCGRFRDRVTRPDGSVVDIALVHRRLSIIDLADGTQPMVIGDSGATGGLPTSALIAREGGPYQPLHTHTCPKCGPGVVAVAFNGCIYNHRELRAELEAAGHEFFTDHSDTEVLLHGWRQWGNAMLDRIEGMYAFIAWDGRTGSTLMARDQFGEKPIYKLDLSHGTCAWASVPGALVHLARAVGEPTRLDPDNILAWIALGYAPETTPFAGIEQLPAGGFECSETGMNRCRPSSLDARGPLGRAVHTFLAMDRGLGNAIQGVEHAIDHAVALRLEADVPVACFLSGGVDSSLVARAAARHVDDLCTICVRMPSESYDESVYARHVADIIGSSHHEVDASADPAADLMVLIPQLGLPFGDSSLLPTHWVSMAAAEVSKVAIGGDGGDELFLGYERYSVADDLVPIQLVAMLTLGFSPLLMPRRDPKSDYDKAARLLVAARKRSYRSLLAIYQHPELARILHPPRQRDLWNDRINTARSAQRDDLDNHLPGDLLRKVDTASMACGLETRSPLLDHALAHMTLSMPIERLRSGSSSIVTSQRQRKGLLRAVARKYLPAEIVDRPKMGFAIPIGEWFRTDFGGMRQLLYDHLESTDPFPGLASAGVEINMGFVRRMLREHDAAGERSLWPWHGRDHSQRLYMLLVLSIWAKWMEQ